MALLPFSCSIPPLPPSPADLIKLTRSYHNACEKPPRPISTFKFAEEPLIESGISDYTFIPKDKGGLLGNGKFSSVQLAWKHGVKVRCKSTSYVLGQDLVRHIEENADPSLFGTSFPCLDLFPLAPFVLQYAIKITPLYPHHNLIATRLLREPTILAQLPLHPNLVKVYESIRTPGHFYLVGEWQAFAVQQRLCISLPVKTDAEMVYNLCVGDRRDLSC